MEYSIDRTSYRRHVNTEVEECEDSKIIYKIIKRLLIQSIAGGIVLMVAYTVKIMNLQPAKDWLKREVHRSVPVSAAYDTIKMGMAKIYENFKIMVNTEEYQNVTIEKAPNEDSTKINESDSILSIHTDVPTEIVYEEAVEGINQMSEDAEYIKNHYQLIYPIQGTVTSRFGVRNSDNPIVTAYHSGIDLAANTGTKIQSALSGTVITATTGEAYGKHIMIQTDDIVLVYAHCSALNVKEGQNVKQGDVIGKVGSTGWATGPHLHFEIRYHDRLVNPDSVLDFGE